MPLVSVLIPCRNEEAFIEKCIQSVLNFKLPENTKLELLVIDGRSDDRSVTLIRQLADHDPRIRCIDNPARFTSFALNTGIQNARGDWILRLDAHAEYPPNYLQLCLETAIRTGADNVGGLFITQPGSLLYSGRLVQALSTHKFGVGDSGFRTGATEGPADTVPYGFYRPSLFQRIGFFDQRLVRGEDYEFNRRVIACGGNVFLNPNIQVRYFNQPTLTAFLIKQLRQEGPYNAYMWHLAPYAFTPRHAITGVFIVGVIGGAFLAPFTAWIAYPYFAVILLYIMLAILSAIQQSLRYREPGHLIALPFSFFLFHMFYGAGILVGLIRLASGSAPVQKIPEPWPGAGFSRLHPHPAVRTWRDLAPQPSSTSDHVRH